MNQATIKAIKAREILDSRGSPTVETKVWLSDGSTAVASVPSGGSVGKHEALELRDNDPKRYNGLGVLGAVANVNEKIAPKLIGFDPREQKKIDQLIIELDGTKNKSSLGANTILSVSQGVCEAGAAAKKIPIYQHVAELSGLKKYALPIPLFNLISGGKHGAGNLDFQEFHIVPLGSPSYAHALQTGEEIYHSVEEVLIRHGAIHSVGDEGGFAPNLFTNLDALEILVDSIKEAGRIFGKDVFLGLDVAGSHFFKDGKYRIRDRTMPLTTEELIEYFVDLHQQYPLYLLEDPLNEDDWGNWVRITAEMKDVFIVGDDLLVTNKGRTQKAVKEKACSAILVKPNQVGTITETIDVVKVAQTAGWKVIVSHRSGETTDDFIADFAVGVGANLVKFGAPARGERVAKYNRLLEIETELKTPR
ncbi:MAG TPA: phosphopyruvate hydratase [Candidatus Bathyarchaeia archaeon]|nr:phosphopyruvate hydratase [Candidatus Bathyarchaeia archaeon]